MICPNCGKDVGDDKKFCTYCGAKLPEKEGESTAGAPAGADQSADVEPLEMPDAGQAVKSGASSKIGLIPKILAIIAAAAVVVLVVLELSGVIDTSHIIKLNFPKKAWELTSFTRYDAYNNVYDQRYYFYDENGAISQYRMESTSDGISEISYNWLMRRKNYRLLDSTTNINSSVLHSEYEMTDDMQYKTWIMYYPGPKDYLGTYVYERDRKDNLLTLNFFDSKGSISFSEEYEYDWRGREIKKTESNSEGISCVTYRIYDNWGKRNIVLKHILIRRSYTHSLKKK